MKVLFLGAFVFCFSSATFAQPLPVIGKTPADPPYSTAAFTVRDGVLWIDGDISEAIVDELMMADIDRGIMGEKRIHHIELNSFGGNIRHLFWMAEIIRERGITTNVREGARCSSACTLVYQAGAKRTAHPSAKFLYHGVRWGPVGAKTFERCFESAEKNERGEPLTGDYVKGMEKYYSSLTVEACEEQLREKRDSLLESSIKLFRSYEVYGASPNLYQDYLAMPIQENWAEIGNVFKRVDMILTAEETMKYNVVQELVETPY